MRRVIFGLIPWSVLLVLLSGSSECAHNRFEIEMKPAGDGLQRTLVVTRQGGEDKTVPAEVLARLAEAYPADGARPGGATHEGDVHRYTGTFTGSLPQDVGGSGSYRVFASKLGRTGAYAERFRGRDDLGVQAQQRLAAVDRLVDLLVGWARWILGEEEGFDRLRVFLDQRLRADLKDLATYAAIGLMLQDYAEGAAEEMAMRVGQLMIERGYFSPAELPRILVAFQRDDALDAKGRINTMSLVRARLAEELGLAEQNASPAVLDFLKTPDSALASLHAYIKTTDGFRRLARTKKDAKPQDVLDALLEDLIQMDLFATQDALALELACPIKPYATNGDWDAQAKRVTWKLSNLRGAPRLPTFAYAHWASPYEDYQRTRFGKLALTGRALSEVIVWRNGLSAGEAKQWDAFLDGLKPGADLSAKLKAFRFEGDPAEGASLADFATFRLLEGLQLADPPAGR